MAEPFKNLINADTVRAAGLHLARAWSKFDRRRFERQALSGLDDLELKARVLHVTAALEATLPEDFAQAAALIEKSLGPAGVGDDLSQLRPSERGLAGWAIWPLGEFVARRGLEKPERALAALHALTQRFSAEFAIRPLIAAHPTLAFRTLKRWTTDPSAHVRRLVSEGSRPRLPWGQQLGALIADPAPTLPLLAALQDDSSAYVRRSVSNHLNDIAKDHPGTFAKWLELHLPEASRERRALLKHASRTLIKRGDRRVLALWGVGAPLRGRARLSIDPARIELGSSLTLNVVLESSARKAQRLVIDYAVHHVKQNGGSSPKVFKGWSLELAPGEERQLKKIHPVKPITTRRYYAGAHRVELRINGISVAQSSFKLRT